MSVDRLTELLSALEAQPTVTREQLLRQAVEAWLKEKKKTIESENTEAEMARVLGGRQTVPLDKLVGHRAFRPAHESSKICLLANRQRVSLARFLAVTPPS